MIKKTDKKKIKIVNLQIDSENHPILFKTDPSELGDICYKIFEYGYRCYFPLDQNASTPNQTDVQVGQICRELDKVTQIDDKLDRFSNVLEDMLGIKNNSSKKGNLSEDIIYQIIRRRFRDCTIQETRHMPHHGDAIIGLPINNKSIKIMVEIKNYTKSVDRDEIDKLISDMKHTGVKYCMFLSFKSSFVGRKEMHIEEFRYHNSDYFILYVPYLMEDVGKIEFALLLINRIVEYHEKNTNTKRSELNWLMTNITDHLGQLDEEYSNFIKIKSQYQKMEKNVKQNLSDFYSILRNYEIELKNSINKIWREVQRDFDQAEQDLIISEKQNKMTEELKQKRSQKNLGLLFDLLIKYQYQPKRTKNKKLWQIITNDTISGSVYRQNQSIQLFLTEPEITYVVHATDPIDDDLARIESILSSVRN